MAGKARVHELAKELGVTSKEVLARLSDQGEFVKSASSTVEGPVAARLRNSFGGGTRSRAVSSALPRKGDAVPGIRVRDLATEVGVTNRQVLTYLKQQGEPAKSSSSNVNAVVAERIREVFNSAPRFVVARVATEIDEPGAPDHLGIDFDAQALAALIASRRMQPPWAIGIYGEWGSGKTFFMHRVEHWVRELEQTPEVDGPGMFEHGIAHVWFNAWHYSAESARANIWAGLMSHIFTTLHPSISDREQKIADVLEHVEAAKEIRDGLDRQVIEAKAVVQETQRRVDDARREYQGAVEHAAQVRGRDLLEAVKLDGAMIRTCG